MQLFEASKSGGRVRAQVALMEEEASKLTSEKSDAVKANTFKAANRLDNRDKMKVNTGGSLATGNDGTREDVAKYVPPALVINSKPNSSATGITDCQMNPRQQLVVVPIGNLLRYVLVPWSPDGLPTDAPTTGAIHARSPSVAGYANNANDDSRSSDGRRVQGGHAQVAVVKLEPGTSAAGVTEPKSSGGNSSGLHESERSTNAPPPMYTERQVKPAPPRLSGPVHFKAPPQECGHDRPGEVPPWATKLDAQREAAGERSRATYAAGRGRIGWTRTIVAPVPPPPTTAHTATDGRKFTLPMARPAQPRVEIEEVRQEGREIAEVVRRERIQRAAKCMRDNRKWFDDENRVRGKGEKAPFDSDLDVLDLSPAEWKDVDAELALCKGGKRK